MPLKTVLYKSLKRAVITVPSVVILLNCLEQRCMKIFPVGHYWAACVIPYHRDALTAHSASWKPSWRRKHRTRAGFAHHYLEWTLLGYLQPGWERKLLFYLWLSNQLFSIATEQTYCTASPRSGRQSVIKALIFAHYFWYSVYLYTELTLLWINPSTPLYRHESTVFPALNQNGWSESLMATSHIHHCLYQQHLLVFSWFFWQCSLSVRSSFPTWRT